MHIVNFACGDLVRTRSDLRTCHVGVEAGEGDDMHTLKHLSFSGHMTPLHDVQAVQQTGGV